MSLATILDNPVKLTRLACLAVVRAGCPGAAGGAQARAPPARPARYPAKHSYRVKSRADAVRGAALPGFTGKHFAACKEKLARPSFLYLGRKVYLRRKIYR